MMAATISVGADDPAVFGVIERRIFLGEEREGRRGHRHERDAEHSRGLPDKGHGPVGVAMGNQAGEHADQERARAPLRRQMSASAPGALRRTGWRSMHAGSFPPLRAPDNSPRVALHWRATIPGADP